jgi:phosphonate transport system permease protein
MSSKPIPMPPPGAELRWRLEAPYSAKHLLILICVFALLLVTGHRT